MTAQTPLQVLSLLSPDRFVVDDWRPKTKKASTQIQVMYQSLTKNCEACGENTSRTGFTSGFSCSISTFRLRELTKSGVSC